MRSAFYLSVAVSAIVALTAISVCAVEAAMFLRDARESLAVTSQNTQSVLLHMENTVRDFDRTVQIAGGAINTARQIERDNRLEIAAVNRETLDTLKNVNGLVVSLDATQKQAGASIAETSAALAPVIEQSARDLAELQPAIHQVTPLLERTTDVAANLSNATADVQHEIHKLVYPPPRKWYQKWFLDPLRTAAHLFTIPIRP